MNCTEAIRLSVLESSSAGLFLLFQRCSSVSWNSYPDVEVIFRDGTLGRPDCSMYREGNVDFMISVFREELPDAVYHGNCEEQVLVALPEHHPAIRMPIRWG